MAAAPADGVAEQKGKNELALHLLGELDSAHSPSPSRSGHRRCCLK
jgi:hypothetical protein